MMAMSSEGLSLRSLLLGTRACCSGAFLGMRLCPEPFRRVHVVSSRKGVQQAQLARCLELLAARAS